MSMHYGGEQGYGLFLNKEEADVFVHEYAAKEDTDMDIWDVTIELGGSYLCDDEYDLRHVCHLDQKEHPEDDEDFVDGIFLYAKKQGCISLEKSDHAYKNLDEMADEFRTAYGEYFPDNFDYVGHLCHFLGANFG